MEIKVIRDTYTNNTTIGQLYIDGAWQCWTLELATPKEGEAHVKGKHCVPLGKYQVTLSLYKGEVYAWMHKLVPAVDKYGLPKISNINDVDYPLWIDRNGIYDDQDVYLHIGTKQSDTLGCLLVGLNKATDTISNSTDAFNKIYPQIYTVIQAGEPVTIEYVQA